MKTNWSVQDSLEHYLISRWGHPFFSINNHGHLECRPKRDIHEGIDLKELIDDLKRRGIKPPVLIRFNDILAAQVEALALCFKTSIDEYNYHATYRTVMPIKVNQQRHE